MLNALNHQLHTAYGACVSTTYATYFIYLFKIILYISIRDPSYIALSILGACYGNVIIIVWFKFHLNSFPAVQFTISHQIVQIIAWCRTDGTPLSQPLMETFTDAYMHQSASIRLKYIRREYEILNDRPWIWPWIKPIFYKLYFIFYMLAS